MKKNMKCLHTAGLLCGSVSLNSEHTKAHSISAADHCVSCRRWLDVRHFPWHWFAGTRDDFFFLWRRFAGSFGTRPISVTLICLHFWYFHFSMALIYWRYWRHVTQDMHWPALMPPNLFHRIHLFALLRLDFSIELLALLALELLDAIDLLA